MSSQTILKYIIAGIIVLALLAGGFWYWYQKKAKAPQESTAEVKDGLGAEAFKKINNPLSNELPQTNPFQVNTNPFK